MRNAKRTVLALSDDVVVRHGITALLRGSASAVSAQPAGIPRGKRPDVVIVDLDHLATDAMSFVRELDHQLAETRLITLGTPLRLAAAADGAADAEVETSRLDDDTLISALDAHPHPPSAELARLHRQWAEVTSRQRDVLRWLAVGLDNPSIAAKLRVGARAVKAHISALLELFGLDNRTQLALHAYQAGLRAPNVR